MTHNIMIKYLKQIASIGLSKVGFNVTKKDALFLEMEPNIADIIRSVIPYTMTSPERIWALIKAVQYILHNNIPGSIVECGVWKGGSMMAVAKTLNLNQSERDLFLYDTYQGMPIPGEFDVSKNNTNAMDIFQKNKINDNSSNWINLSLEECKQNMYSTQYNKSKIHFVKGKVEDTLPLEAPEDISLLRLDTDFYKSTKHELTHLFPRLARGGILLIDDYGHWKGSKKAVDEYIAENKICIHLQRIDYTARIAVKI